MDRAFFCARQMAEGTQRSSLDWERIETDYCLGRLSVREIGRQHKCTEGAIRKRAKVEGWERDLSGKVDEAVRKKLVRKAVRAATVSDRDIVEEAAETCVAVILEHRKDLARLREMEEKFLAELEGKNGEEPTKLYITQYQGEIVEKEVGLTVTEKASTLLALATARAKRIELERKAFNLDNERGEDKGEQFIVQLTPQDALL